MVEHSDSPETVLPRLLRTAEARALGISARQLAGPLWTQAWRGVHVSYEDDKNDPAIRVQTAGALLPESAALGGWAALHARKVVALDGRIGLTGEKRPILACVGPVGLIVARPGLIIDRAPIPSSEISICSGVRW